MSEDTMTERERLARLLDQWAFSDKSNIAYSYRERALQRADRIIASGWRYLPTEGPEFEAGVERAAQVLWRAERDDAWESATDLARVADRTLAHAAIRAFLNMEEPANERR